MNLTGLEQFHQGKSDDETHRSPLEASQSQVHRAEGSADVMRGSRVGPEICDRAVAQMKARTLLLRSPYVDGEFTLAAIVCTASANVSKVVICDFRSVMELRKNIETNVLARIGS